MRTVRNNSTTRAKTVLRFEQLEDRRVLATFMVTDDADLLVAGPGQAPGTLRQAIFDANELAGTDEIVFDLPPASTITLVEGELEVTESINIVGPGIDELTIDASGNDTTPNDNEGNGSRVFFIAGQDLEATISGLTLSGADEFANGGAIYIAGSLLISECLLIDNSADYGGGIYVALNSTLEVANTRIEGNHAYSRGGGIFVEGESTATVADSEIIDNVAGNETYSGNQSGGGIAVWARDLATSDLTVLRTLLDSNSAPHGYGGGISFVTTGPEGGSLEIRESRLTNNLAEDGSIWSVTGPPDPMIHIGGGGLYARTNGTVLIADSAVDNNHSYGRGGGLDLGDSNTTIINTTISSNEAMEGGGVWAANALIQHSTITLNRAGIRPEVMLTEPFTTGGGGLHIGIFRGGGTAGTVLEHTIISGNFHDCDDDDEWLLCFPHENYEAPDIGFFYSPVDDDNPVTLLASYTIVGSTAGPLSQSFTLGDSDIDLLLSGAGNQTNVDPLLDQLSDNGGPTPTHALLTGSPAIDAGNPSFVPPPVADQRTPPYLRVYDGDGDMVDVIDIGAFELQPEPEPILSGDYNDDGVANAADYVIWRDTLGAFVAPPFSGADGDGSGEIDQPDYVVWKDNFGSTLPAESVASRMSDNEAINVPVGASELAEAPMAASSPLAIILAGATSADRPPFSRAVSRGTASISSNGSAERRELLELALLDSIPQPSRSESAEDELLNYFIKEETADFKVLDNAFADWHELSEGGLTANRN